MGRGHIVAAAAAMLVGAVLWVPPAAATEGPATCAPGDIPERGVQGQVTAADRASGASAAGAHCNLSIVGQFQGNGASWVSPSYGHCAYVSQSLVGNLLSPERGVRVLDVSDPSAPRQTALLTTPAMAGDTWESLKVDEERGLLAAVAVGPFVGAAFFDIYDIATDCAHPRLLNSVPGTELSIPANVIGHEGGFSPDGRTYWASGVVAGSLTAIDVSDPTRPSIAWTGLTTLLGHGFDLSPDGNQLFMTTTVPTGFVTLDVSQVQARAPFPVVTQVGVATWSGAVAPQHTISISYRGDPWVIAVDEIGDDGIHVVDLSGPTPVVHTGPLLEIEGRPDLAGPEVQGDVLGLFGYSPHYCAVDRVVEPTALACGYFQSGVRVFDIRDLLHPREIAYFNPPAQAARRSQLTASWHASALGDLTADWCTSPPRFVDDQLWVTCQDNGFLALRFAPGTYPFPTAATGPEPTTSTITGPTTTTAAAPAGRQLPVTGGDGRLAFALVLLVGAVALGGALRRAHPPAGVLLLVAATVAPNAGSEQAAADVTFARDMVRHHLGAIAMAEAVLDEPLVDDRTRALARQIVAQQAVEVRQLSQWLAEWGVEVPGPDEHVRHGVEVLADARSDGPDPFKQAFLRSMRAHHAAAIPIAEAARAAPGSRLRAYATAMEAEQVIELVHLDRVLGAGTAGAMPPGSWCPLPTQAGGGR